MEDTMLHALHSWCKPRAIHELLYIWTAGRRGIHRPHSHGTCTGSL